MSKFFTCTKGKCTKFITVTFQYEKLFKYYHMEISSNNQAMNMYPIELMLKEQCVDIAVASILQSMTFCCDHYDAMCSFTKTL